MFCSNLNISYSDACFDYFAGDGIFFLSYALQKEMKCPPWLWEVWVCGQNRSSDYLQVCNSRGSSCLCVRRDPQDPAGPAVLKQPQDSMAGAISAALELLTFSLYSGAKWGISHSPPSSAGSKCFFCYLKSLALKARPRAMSQISLCFHSPQFINCSVKPSQEFSQ